MPLTLTSAAHRQIAATLGLHSHPHPRGHDLLAWSCVSTNDKQTAKYIDLRTNFSLSFLEQIA